MKKILVFGATGGTGNLVVEQALIQGHHVTVIVRDVNAFIMRRQHLKILRGDVFQPATFRDAFADIDVVVSCLGIQKKEATTVYSNGIINIIEAMREHNVKRLICLSAGAVIVPPKGSIMTKFFIKNIFQKIFAHLYIDMLVMEKIVKSTTALDYTIIRPPWLRDTKRTGKYRLAINGHLENPTKIARADLADFIVSHLTDSATYRSTVELSY